MKFLTEPQRAWLKAQSVDVRGEFDEVAAILEYDGHHVREVAEQRAFGQVYKGYRDAQKHSKARS